jgi:predicted phosphate transport protein (TIGR00153 family)
MELAKNFALFRRTRELENQVDDFLDKLSQSALLFRNAIETYMADGASEEFEEKLKHVNSLESEADSLRRSVETQLYSQTLIPESRGDVLGLMENLDSVLNDIEGALWSFSIEASKISAKYHGDFAALADKVTLSAASPSASACSPTPSG